jgi:hypothetical protein
LKIMDKITIGWLRDQSRFMKSNNIPPFGNGKWYIAINSENDLSLPDGEMEAVRESYQLHHNVAKCLSDISCIDMKYLGTAGDFMIFCPIASIDVSSESISDRASEPR